MAVPLAYFLVKRYKKAIVDGMSKNTGIKIIDPEHDRRFNRTGLKIETVDLDSVPLKNTKLFYHLKETLGSHLIGYFISCLVFAIYIGIVFFINANLSGTLTFLFVVLIFLFPLVPVSFILIARSKLDRYILIGLYGFIFIVSIYIVDGISNNPESNFDGLMKAFMIYNTVPTAGIFLLRLEKIKSIGMFVFSFVVVALTGPVFLFSYLIGHPDSSETLSKLFIEMGLGVYETLAAWIILPLIMASIIGWLCLKAIRNLYIQKKINEMQLLADGIMIIFNLCYSSFFFIADVKFGLISLLAFPFYKMSNYLWFGYIGKRRIANPSPTLLILRVFNLGVKGKSLFEMVFKHWRYAGSVQLITGPDLAATTLEPHEFMEFITGNLKNSFCNDTESLDQKLDAMDHEPDKDGTHRVNEMMCRNDTWKSVLKSLTMNSDLVLMDLRSFSEKFKGCRYEIDALINMISMDRVFFIVNGETDLNYCNSIFEQSYQYAGIGSPNANDSVTIKLFYMKSGKNKEVFKLLDILCSKISN
ncbi:MAG: hypothetical protein H6605_01655 [Flavobacteriales bacterium]|nr:hypothetical protein [Flavobacteriales bacterium]